MTKLYAILAALTILARPLHLAAADHDGDLLLDSWEEANGLSSNLWDTSNSGLGDYWDDPDHDGLANHSELVAGTSPTNAYTHPGGTNDYFYASGASYFGSILTDNDHVDDRWEIRYQPYTSLAAWDEHLDLDGDGWDNWSERRAGTTPSSAAIYPTPSVAVTVDYNGVSGNVAQTLVIQSYTDPYMQGVPDVVYQTTINATNGYPLAVTLSQADVLTGHIRQGTNYMFAFFNSDGSTVSGMGPSWSNGDPAAVADGHADGIEIGWDLNEVRFGLTDEAMSFARFAWDSDDDQSKLIEIGNLSDTVVYFSKNLSGPRTWLHEGDIIADNNSQFGIAWGYAASPDNVVKYRVANGTSFMLGTLVTGYITNNYSATLDTPVAIYPRSDAEVYDARPDFRFRLAPEATEFDFTLTRGGSTVFTGRYLAPPRQALDGHDDVVVWSSPFCLGDVTDVPLEFASPTNTYSYTVKAYSPAQTAGSDASTAASFVASVDSDASTCPGKGWLAVSVTYPGPAGATNAAPIRVQAYSTHSFNGLPAAQKQISNGAGATVTLAGLIPGAYYILAYVDLNNNRIRDALEPWGYVATPNDQHNPFRPAAVYARPRDADPVLCHILGAVQ